MWYRHTEGTLVLHQGLHRSAPQHRREPSYILHTPLLGYLLRPAQHGPYICLPVALNQGLYHLHSRFLPSLPWIPFSRCPELSNFKVWFTRYHQIIKKWYVHFRVTQSHVIHRASKQLCVAGERSRRKCEDKERPYLYRNRAAKTCFHLIRPCLYHQRRARGGPGSALSMEFQPFPQQLSTSETRNKSPSVKTPAKNHQRWQVGGVEAAGRLKHPTCNPPAACLSAGKGKGCVEGMSSLQRQQQVPVNRSADSTKNFP